MDSGGLPLTGQEVDYDKQVRQALKANVDRLLKCKNVSGNALAIEAGVSTSRMTGINELKATRIETIAKLAKALGVQAWHLLVPNFDPDNPERQ
jgi:DNA-binding Xre family transcriptional regulator